MHPAPIRAPNRAQQLFSHTIDPGDGGRIQSEVSHPIRLEPDLLGLLERCKRLEQIGVAALVTAWPIFAAWVRASDGMNVSFANDRGEQTTLERQSSGPRFEDHPRLTRVHGKAQHATAGVSHRPGSIQGSEPR